MDRRNARAMRSKAALKKAFLELFQTKEPEEISVSLLCQQAHVNRSTFYAHYNYRDQLVKEVLWESVQEAFAGRAQQWSLPLENGGVQRRFIRVYIGLFKSQLYISVSNSTCEKKRRRITELVTTKLGEHGFGLRRIDKLAEKYNGYVNRKNEPGIFATEVMLPL